MGSQSCWALGLTLELGAPPAAQCSRLGVVGTATCPWGLRAPFLPTGAKITGLYNDSELPQKTLCRGVLMTLPCGSGSLVTSESSSCKGGTGAQGLRLILSFTHRPPPLCGAIPASGDYVTRPGDKVAAWVKAVDGDEQWILAKMPQDDYSTLPEDTSYADSFSPHLSVAQRYLVASKEPKKK
ncbi:hypothetical protein P7K49_023264 [Saguinus oedipus]|uniref:Uncharacterized protein n=1 Tax=Saguinus oedipus TaxID=9490 RepID=A0ABQ9UL83_SAGOE|nr:hypothetical protein P7K49_023264 [Saguinus oedipus]